MSIASAVLALMLALIFFTLGTANGAEAPAPTPPSFLAPEDLAAPMTGAHQGQ